MASKLIRPLDLVDRPLQRGVLEGDHPAAVATDRVVVVLAVGLDALIARDSPRDLDAAQQAELLELLERAVDAGPPHPGLAPPQLVVEVQRGDGAIVASEGLDDDGAGAAAAVAGGSQGGESVLGPARAGGGAHASDPRDSSPPTRSIPPAPCGRARRRQRATAAASRKAAVATPITAVLAGSAGTPVAERQPGPHRADGDRAREPEAAPGVVGKQPRRAARRRQEAEQEERADRLRRLRRDHRQEDEEAEAERPHRHAEAARHLVVDRGEEQRPGDRQQRQAGEDRDRRGEAGVGRGEAEDRAEEDADRGGAVGAARAADEDREEERAEAEDPGEDRADHDVVGTGALAEQPHPARHRDRRHEQTEPDVDSRRRGSQGAGEGNVAERIAGEDLAAQDDEVADQPAGKRDRGAGEKGVAHELMGEHQAGSPVGRAIGRRRTAPRHNRTST